MREELYNLKLSPTLTNLETIRDKYNLDCVEEGLTCLSKKYATDYFNVYKSLKTAYFDTTPASFIPAQPSVTFISDWYMPSYLEVLALYTNLHLEGLGNFVTGSQTYLTSSEYLYPATPSSPTACRVVYFATGALDDFAVKDTLFRVRPIRSFISETPISIGTIGISGGYVFYEEVLGVNNYKYYEAAPQDIVSVAWGAMNVSTEIIAEAIGTGVINSNSLIGVLNNLGETGKAVQACAALSVPIVT